VSCIGCIEYRAKAALGPLNMGLKLGLICTFLKQRKEDY
jgi:hypothetical protein